MPGRGRDTRAPAMHPLWLGPFPDASLEDDFIRARIGVHRARLISYQLPLMECLDRQRFMWVTMGVLLSALLYSQYDSGDLIVPAAVTLIGVGYGLYFVVALSTRRSSPSMQRAACTFFTVALVACGVCHCLFAVEHETPGVGYVLLFADAGATALGAYFAHEFHYRPAGKVVLCLTSTFVHLMVPVWRVGRLLEMLTFLTAATIGALGGHKRERSLRQTFLEGLHGVIVQSTADTAHAESRAEIPTTHAEPPTQAPTTEPMAPAPTAPAEPSAQTPVPVPQAKPPTAGTEPPTRAPTTHAGPQPEKTMRKRTQRDDLPRARGMRDSRVLLVACPACKKQLRLPVTFDELKGIEQVQCGECMALMRLVK